MFDQSDRPQNSQDGKYDAGQIDPAISKLQESLFTLPQTMTKKVDLQPLSSTRQIEPDSKDPDWPIAMHRHQTAKSWTKMGVDLFDHADANKNGYLDKKELAAQNTAWSEYVLSEYDSMKTLIKDHDFKIDSSYYFIPKSGFFRHSSVTPIPSDDRGVSKFDLICYPPATLFPETDSASQRATYKAIGNNTRIDAIEKKFEANIDWSLKELSTRPKMLHELMNSK